MIKVYSVHCEKGALIGWNENDNPVWDKEISPLYYSDLSRATKQAQILKGFLICETGEFKHGIFFAERMKVIIL